MRNGYRRRVVVESDSGAERARSGVDRHEQLLRSERSFADAGAAAIRPGHIRTHRLGADPVVDGARDVTQLGRQLRPVAFTADGRHGRHRHGHRRREQRDSVVDDGRVERHGRVRRHR